MLEKKAALVVYGGNVWTGDDANPSAEAFLVENGRFTAVGDRESVLSAAGGKPVVAVDAEGSLVIPGITDAHMHLTAYCKESLYLNLSGASSLDALLESVAQYVRANPARRWFRAVGYNETLWDEPVSPTREALDAASGGASVLLSRYCGHVHVASSRAIRDAGLWDSADANVTRGEDGEPGGVLNESAAEPILREVTREQETRGMIRALAAEACKRLASMGITGVHACDVPSYGLPEDLTILGDLRDEGKLPLRVVSYHDRLPGIGFHSGFGDRFLRYGGLKVFIDGNLGGFTSAMREDFSDRAGCRGQLNHSDEELFELLREAALRSVQTQMHMIGDAAIDQAIRVSGRVVRELGKPRYPFRFNHVIVSPPDRTDAMLELGAVIDVQPIQSFTDRSMAPSRLGRERMKHTYSFRRLYDSGLLMTGSSDGPMENPNPWLGIWAAVCHANETERLTLDEALRIYTWNPHRAILRGEGFGRIAEGVRADFAILENDPFKHDAQSLKDTKIRATYLEGERTY